MLRLFKITTWLLLLIAIVGGGLIMDTTEEGDEATVVAAATIAHQRRVPNHVEESQGWVSADACGADPIAQFEQTVTLATSIDTPSPQLTIPLRT